MEAPQLISTLVSQESNALLPLQHLCKTGQRATAGNTSPPLPTTVLGIKQKHLGEATLEGG